MSDTALVAQYAERHGFGEHRIKCPFCSHERSKKHERTMSLTVRDDHFLYNCWHCGEHSAAKLKGADFLSVQPRERERPVAVAKAMDTRALADDCAEWLESRGISRETAEAKGCKQVRHWIAALQKETECIAFPYKNKGKVYSAKIRSIGEKGFAANGSPQTFFNAENIEDWSEIIIVEGEMDVLSFSEAGIDNAVSVPNGSPAQAPKDEDDKRLRFLKNHADDLEKTERAILMLDADEPGQIMADEIARRIGKDKCWYVEFPEGCKDANDVLMKHGKEGLERLIADAQPWPISGLYDAGHFFEGVYDLYDNGVGKGATTGLPSLDKIYSIMPGQMTIITGHPGSGKSELVDQIMIHLAQENKWKSAICSFENEPPLHIAKLAQKYIGKQFFTQTGYKRMSPAERDMALEFVRENFSFLYSNDGSLASLDSIIDRLKAAVLRHGIRLVVIDPYNYIQKAKDQSETDWVSVMLAKVRSFAQAHGVHVFFVAHPTKMMRSADGTMGVPKGNDISGSAAWWAKADMGLTVHRPDPEYSNMSEFHVWKVRFSWCGKQGKSEAYFNTESFRYFEDGIDPTAPPPPPF